MAPTYTHCAVQPVRSGTGGVIFEVAKLFQSQIEVKPETGLTAPGAQAILNTVNAPSPGVRLWEEKLRADLKRLQLPPTQTIDVLLRSLAQEQTRSSFEAAYRIIFGSQIALLKHLNVGGRNTKDEIREFYDFARFNFAPGQAHAPLDVWLDFLLSNRLITENDGRIDIATDGREFLMWMAANGVTENKPL